MLVIQYLALLLSCSPVVAADPEQTPKLPALVETTVKSSIDGEGQAVLFWAPKVATQEKTPLLVFSAFMERQLQTGQQQVAGRSG